MPSRRGKFCDLQGVGLAIVVALEKKDELHGAVRADEAFGSRSSGRSNPIPVKWPENSYRSSFEVQSIKTKSLTIFDISPVRFGSIITFPCSDVLNSCHLCGKKLHGKDIYMYRGEKAFCSAECRSRQIVIDERRENCTSEALRSVDVSNSPTTDRLALSTRITAI